MPREQPAGKTLRSMGLPQAVLDDITWNNCVRFPDRAASGGVTAGAPPAAR